MQHEACLVDKITKASLKVKFKLNQKTNTTFSCLPHTVLTNLLLNLKQCDNIKIFIFVTFKSM